jgi:hypothetical protein
MDSGLSTEDGGSVLRVDLVASVKQEDIRRVQASLRSFSLALLEDLVLSDAVLLEDKRVRNILVVKPPSVDKDLFLV